MAYNIDEILGDIRFEVIGDRVIFKLKEGVIPEHTNDITNLVKVDDITKPSDSNVFSSLRVLSEIAKAIGSIDVSGSYLRKDVEDTATERINFSKGIKIGNAILAWDEVSGALRISESVFSDKEVSAYGFGSDHGNGESGSLGGLVNVGQWADEVASSDRVIVQLAGATHWSSMLLSEIVGLDTQALASYLTSNNYATKSYVTGEISNIDFHNHDNKSILDHLTQDDIDVLSHLKLVDGRITLSGNLNFNTSANQINSTSAVELALNYAGGGARHTSIFNGQGGFIMRAHANGNVGIGTSEPQYKLDVNGSGHYASELYLDYGLRISNAAGSGEGISLFAESSTNPNYGLMFARTIYKGTHGSVNGDWATYFTMSPDAGRGWIFTSNAAGTGGNVVSISNWGNLTCSGEVTAYSASDRRLKTDIVTLKDSLRIIELLNPVSYKWNSIAKELNPMKGDEKDYGLIAQELECVMPELVHSIYDGKYKSIDYVKLIPHLVCAIKELKMEVDRLKK